MAEGTILLQNLKITEVSAVDGPANLLDGWAVVKSRGGLKKAISEFQQLLSDIQTRDGWDDDEKVEAMKTAIAGVPEAISVPAMKNSILADRIRKAHGLRHPATGQYTSRAGHALATHTAAKAPTPEPALLPWSHQGARLFGGDQ